MSALGSAGVSASCNVSNDSRSNACICMMNASLYVSDTPAPCVDARGHSECALLSFVRGVGNSLTGYVTTLTFSTRGIAMRQPHSLSTRSCTWQQGGSLSRWVTPPPETPGELQPSNPETGNIPFWPHFLGLLAQTFIVTWLQGYSSLYTLLFLYLFSGKIRGITVGYTFPITRRIRSV